MKNNEFEIKDGVLCKYNGDGGDVAIPNGVTKIGDGAFYDCSSLTSVTIPDSVTEIGMYAFYDCSSLTSVTIPDSVTKIGNDAFSDCLGLTSINIPNSVTSISRWVFYGCSNLTSINMSDSVTKIGYCAFSGTRIKRQPQGHIAYKGFNVDMTCLDFEYGEDKTYVCEEAELCKCGFHACTNPLDCFSYYSGENVVYHEVILEDRTDEIGHDSKVCGRKITIGRRLTLKEMVEVFNDLNKNI